MNIGRNSMRSNISKSDKRMALGCAASPILIWGYFVICWIVNLITLLRCDFDGPSYKDEIIHAIGLIGPAAGITVWF